MGKSRKISDREMCVPTSCASSISSSASTKLNSAIWALSGIIGLCDILTLVLGRFNGEILTTVGTGLVMMLIGFLAAGFGLALLQNKSEKNRPVIEAVTICLTLLVSVASLGVCAVQAYLLTLRTLFGQLANLQNGGGNFQIGGGANGLKTATSLFWAIEYILIFVLFIVATTTLSFESCCKWRAANNEEA